MVSESHGPPYRVFVVDDSTTARMGARAILAAIPEFVHVGEAASGDEAVRTLGDAHPDMVLMDVSMPGMSGVDATRRLVAEHPSVQVIAWTTSLDSDDLVDMLRAGCSGYTLKDLGPTELRNALLVALTGEMPIPRQLIPSILQMAAAAVPARSRSQISLTRREKDVLDLLVEGRLGKEIASQLGISAKSVETYTTTLYAKLGVKNRSQATATALRLGLVPMREPGQP